MATRKISVRLAIDGEAAYKASIGRINAELKNHQSSLRLVEARYQGQETSIEALTAKGEALQKLYDTQSEKAKKLGAVLEGVKSAEEKLTAEKTRLTDSLKKTRQELEALEAAGKGNTKSARELQDKEKELAAELARCEKSITSLEGKEARWQTSLNKTQTELVNLDRELKSNRTSLKNYGQAAEDTAKAGKRHAEITEDQSKALDNLSTILIGAGIPKRLTEIKDALVSCVEASIQFESAMAGVKKTTDLSEEELSAMGNTFQKLSLEIPITANELAGIAESAGQLGIQKESITGFTQTMANLGVATNLTSEEAATLLARFANVTGMEPDKYENLGSTVVALGRYTCSAA